jgi:hypothetical protein
VGELGFLMNDTLTRRAVLKLGGAVGLTFIVGGATSAAATRASGTWSRSTYVGLVGASFRVRGYDSKLKLTRIDDLPHRPVGSEAAFALTFQAARGAPLLPHARPSLYHPSTGWFTMMVSPVLTTRPGRPYVAVIDRTHG